MTPPIDPLEQAFLDTEPQTATPSERIPGAPAAPTLADVASDDPLAAAFRETEPSVGPTAEMQAANRQPAPSPRAAELARELDVPVDFAERNAGELESEKRLRDAPFGQFEMTPTLRRALENPETGEFTLKDIQSLSDLSAALRQTELREALDRRRRGATIRQPAPISEVVRNRFELGRRMAFELDEAVFPLLLRDLGVGPEPTKTQLARYQELMERPIGPIDTQGIVDDLFGATAEQLPILGRIIGAGGVGSAVGAGAGALLGGAAGSAVPGVGTVGGAASGAAFGAKVGGGAAAGISIGKLEAAAAYTEFVELRDAAGDPLPPNVVAAGAVAVGAINAGIEAAGLATIARAIPGANALVGAGRRSIQAAVSKQLLDPAKRPALLAAAKKLIVGIAGEAVTEAAQEGVNVEVGRVISGEGLGLSEQEASRLAQAGLQGALAAGPLVAAGQFVEVSMERIASARERAGRIEAARKAVAKAESRGASPETFAAVTSEIAAEAGISKIRIPAEELLNRYAEAGLDRDAALEDAPEIRAQLADALATGGDVEVRPGTYFAKLEPRLGDALTPDLRLSKDGLTAREADASEATMESVVSELVEQDVSDSPEVVAAAQQRGLTPLFRDPESAGMTPEEFAAYEGAVSSGRVQAAQKLQEAEERARRVEERRLKAEQGRFARARRTATREVTAEVDARPVSRALGFLRTRVDGQQEQRLDRDRIVSLYGEDVLAQLPRGIWQNGGLHPDSVAELFGYANGLELVEDILRFDRAAEIEDGVKARLIEEFGSAELDPPDPADPTIEEGIRALLIEERALARRAGRGSEVTPWKVAIRAAGRMVDQERVGSLAPQRSADAAQKAARAAVEAVAAGDFDAARQRKREQIMQLAIEREARNRQKKLDRSRRELQRISRRPAQQRIGKVEGGYLDQVNQLLERFGFRIPEPPDPANPRQTMLSWIAEARERGEEVIAAEWLQTPGQGMAWADLTAQQARELSDAVANIAALAREESQLRTRAEREQLSTVTERISGKIREEFPKSKISKRLTPSLLDRAKAQARGFSASLAMKEFVIDALGGNDPGSFLRRFVWEPLADAQDQYNLRLEEYTQKLRSIVSEAGLDKRGREIVAENRLKDPRDGLPFEFTRWNLISVALNLGNASNRTKLLEGYQWDARVVQAVLDKHLTESDWKFVQNAWDLVGSLWPEISALEQRVTGVKPPKIQPETLQTRFGELRGGYFPVVYDPARSTVGQRAEIAETGKAERVQRFATTGHGHTKERTGVVAPISLDSSVLSAHMDKVILDLTHREALRDAARVLSSDQVNSEVQRALGQEYSYSRFWAPWLSAIAGESLDQGTMRIWDRAARAIRLRGTVFTLGLRITTLALQPVGLVNGFRTLQQGIGGSATEPFIRGLMQSVGYGNLAKRSRTQAEVAERSEFMRNRIKTIDRDMRDVVRNAQRRGWVTKKPVAEFAMELIGRVQRDFVDVPIWLAAYDAAVGKMGMTEDRAVRFADSMVRKSQGSGEKISQSAFQQGPEIWKALTMFYSYNNLVFNQLFKSSRIRGVQDVPTAIANYGMYALLPGMLSSAIYATIKGGLPDPDDDDYEQKVAKEIAQIAVGDVASTIPFVRDATAIFHVGSPKSSSVFERIYRESGDLINVKDGMDLMFDAFRIAAFASGLPGDSPLRAAEDALRGEDD